LVDWSIGRLVDWSIGRLVDWSIGRLVDWLIDLQIPHMLRWIRNAFTKLAMCDYPYPTNFLAPLPGHPVNVACEMMARESSKLKGLVEVNEMVYNGTNGTLSCLDPDNEFIDCADPTGCGLGPDSLAQDYQVLQTETYFGVM